MFGGLALEVGTKGDRDGRGREGEAIKSDWRMIEWRDFSNSGGGEGEDVTFPDPDLGPFRGRTERREGRKDGPLMQYSDSSHPNSVMRPVL